MLGGARGIVRASFIHLVYIFEEGERTLTKKS